MPARSTRSPSNPASTRKNSKVAQTVASLVAGAPAASHSQEPRTSASPDAEQNADSMINGNRAATNLAAGAAAGALEPQLRFPDPDDLGWMWLPSSSSGAAGSSSTAPGEEASPNKGKRGKASRGTAAAGSAASNNLKDEAIRLRIFSLIMDKLRQYRYKEPGTGILKDLAHVLEECPDPEADPTYYEKIEKPTSLSAISQRIKANEYPDAIAFESDVLQLFENVRSLFELGTPIYGEMLVFQRFYQELVSWRKGCSLAEVESHIESVATAGNDNGKMFASVPLGPGYATTLPPGFGEGKGAEQQPSATSSAVSSVRISSKDRSQFEHAYYKGQSFRAGDWVHMINPSEPAKPMIGQVFKVLQRNDQPGQFYLTVCWYYRPEDTVHPPSRQFFLNEVFKTGIMVDHKIQDVLEKTCVMFYTRFIRGRPKAEHWNRKSELYITESRYNEQQRVFNKIKSWNSCVPEEVRKTEVPMDLFDKPMPAPPRVDSPFNKGVKGPGSLCREEDVRKPGNEHEFPDLFKSQEKDEDAAIRKRKREKERERREAKRLREMNQSKTGSDAEPAPTTPFNGGAAAHAQIFRDLAGQLAHRIGPQAAAAVEAQLTGPQSATVDLRQLAQYFGPSIDVGLLAYMRDAAARGGLVGNTTGLGVSGLPVPAEGFDGLDPLSFGASVTSAMQGTEAYFDTLSVEARAMFGRDPVTEQPLWFAAPPLDMGVNSLNHENAMQSIDSSTGSDFPHHLRSPTPSLDYLYHQALRETTSSQGNASSPLTPSSLSDIEWGEEGTRFASFSSGTGAAGGPGMLPLSPATTALSIYEGEAIVPGASSKDEAIGGILGAFKSSAQSSKAKHAIFGAHSGHHSNVIVAPSEHEQAFGTPDLFSSDFGKIYDGAHFTPLSAFLTVDD